MNKICITGANGFIGKSLCKSLISFKKPIIALVRNELDFQQIKNKNFLQYSLNGNLKKYFQECHCIVHCAGMVYKDKLKLEEYSLVNIDLTKKIVEQAIAARVKRFIFISTIKVNGENTSSKDKMRVFKYNDKPDPQNNYGISKLEAEKMLWDKAKKTGLEVVIIRLPLVYGRGVKGNINRLIKLINSRIPLPFLGIKNQRSLIGIDNLTDLIIRCIDHPKAAGKTFLASDGKDVSTPELIKIIASSMGKSARLFSIPTVLIKFLGFIFRKHEEIDRIVGTLQIDITYTKKTLNWTPPVSVKEGIRRMVQDW